MCGTKEKAAGLEEIEELFVEVLPPKASGAGVTVLAVSLEWQFGWIGLT